MKNGQSQGQIFGFHKIYISDNGKEAIIKRGCSDFWDLWWNLETRLLYTSILMKPNEQYFSDTHYLFGFKWWFELVSLWTKSQSVTIQMNDTKQNVPVVLFITLYKVILTFESVEEILKCDHSNKRYWAVISCGTGNYAVEGGSNFWVSGRNPEVWPFKWTVPSSNFLWSCVLCCSKWF